ncbi:MAG: lysoplasmalogenase [Ginsengibacter sp.]
MHSFAKFRKDWLLGTVCFYIIYLLMTIPHSKFPFYSKPFLLLPLIIILFSFKGTFQRSVLLGALFFSWVGDILLLFVETSPGFFIGGLASFLVAHIFYCILFASEMKLAKAKKYFSARVLIAILIYLVGFLSFLFPYLGALKIPVFIYAFVISMMLYMALLLAKYWTLPVTAFLVSGALSFVISDSLLAINKFYHPIPYSGFWIMLTYLYAQLALVYGWILQKSPEPVKR